MSDVSDVSDVSSGSTRPALRHAVRAVAVRPTLWPIALCTVLRLAKPGWWRRWPPLPYPDGAYWRFRMTTAYGGEGDTAPDPADVVEFLWWCRERRLLGRDLDRDAAVRAGGMHMHMHVQRRKASRRTGSRLR